jgi:hypothetical protein
MSKFEYKDGFIFDDGVRMGMHEAVNALNCMSDKLTRIEQPERKTVEESEPEWTHERPNGIKCKFFKKLAWSQGDVYESEDGQFFIPQRTGKTYSIKPIKPAITKADAEMILGMTITD